MKSEKRIHYHDEDGRPVQQWTTYEMSATSTFFFNIFSHAKTATWIKLGGEPVEWVWFSFKSVVEVQFVPHYVSYININMYFSKYVKLYLNMQYPVFMSLPLIYIVIFYMSIY